MIIHVYKAAEPHLKAPLAGFCIHAGFESPGTDYEEDRISLDEQVQTHKSSVYYIRVKGDCMENSGIFEDDLLVVDKSRVPRNGDIIVGVLDGEHILACYIEHNRKKYLVPDNPQYPPIKIEQYSDFVIEGVVPFNLLDQTKQRDVRINRLQQFLR